LQGKITEQHEGKKSYGRPLKKIAMGEKMAWSGGIEKVTGTVAMVSPPYRS
jgi:hypothetical protein